MNIDQITHELAIAYINNQYGVDVTGKLSVTSSTKTDNNAVDDVSGSGSVVTKRLPDIYALVRTLGCAVPPEQHKRYAVTDMTWRSSRPG